MQACGAGHLEVVNNLLDSGADPNHSSKVCYLRAKFASTTDESLRFLQPGWLHSPDGCRVEWEGGSFKAVAGVRRRSFCEK
jgi:hypothetical protein